VSEFAIAAGTILGLGLASPPHAASEIACMVMWDRADLNKNGVLEGEEASAYLDAIKIVLVLALVASAALSETSTAFADRGADAITVLVAPDPGGIEKGLTGTHILRTRAAERSRSGDAAMTVGCAPCLNVYLSFALMHGRLYAMKPQTDNRRLRYQAFVNGSEVPIEAMNGLRGRDWIDAFGGVDHVPGCAPILAGGQWLDPLTTREEGCLSELPALPALR
jgi:hypothetical protein